MIAAQRELASEAIAISGSIHQAKAKLDTKLISTPVSTAIMMITEDVTHDYNMSDLVYLIQVAGA